MKTALGSSPRRQSSMAPRGSSAGLSSPIRAAAHPIARRLDFEHDDSSLQDNIALSGSGARRGQRNGASSVYDIPEDDSPPPEDSAIFEESLVQEQITANDEPLALGEVEEESFAAHVGDDTTTGAEATEDLIEDLIGTEEADNANDVDDVPEPIQAPAKRGRKRKSHVLEPSEQATDSAASRKRGPASAQEKKGSSAQAASSRRSLRVSDISGLEARTTEDAADVTVDMPEPINEPAPQPKRRGRPPRVQPASEKEKSSQAKNSETSVTTAKPENNFKKPAKAVPKPKVTTEPKKPGKTSRAQDKDKTPQVETEDAGKLVNAWGNPLSKKDVEQMSTASAGSRYGRGRHLSVFRELDPEAVARVGRTGRHRVAPIDFWKNESINYDVDGSMTAIVKNQDPEPERKKSHYRTSAKSKKRTLTAVEEEEEIELEPWEEQDGVLVGNFKEFDHITNLTTPNIEEGGKKPSANAAHATSTDAV